MGGGLHDPGGERRGHSGVDGVAALPQNTHSGLGGELGTPTHHPPCTPNDGPVGIFALTALGVAACFG